MDAEEREIYYYLKSWKSEFISNREISRRAGGKHKFRDDHDWARPVLDRMAERGILESNSEGHYRIKPHPSPSDNKTRKWVSPQVAKILKESGKNFGDSVILDNDGETDAYYENL